MVYVFLAKGTNISALIMYTRDDKYHTDWFGSIKLCDQAPHIKWTKTHCLKLADPDTLETNKSANQAHQVTRSCGRNDRASSRSTSIPITDLVFKELFGEICKPSMTVYRSLQIAP